MSETRIVKDAVLADFETEDSVLLDIDGKRYHRMNETASLIWKALEKNASNAEIVDQLMNQFEVTREQAEASVQRFVQDLAARGLVRP